MGKALTKRFGEANAEWKLKERAAKERRAVENADMEETFELRHQENADRRAEQKYWDGEERKQKSRQKEKQIRAVCEQREFNREAKVQNSIDTIAKKAQQVREITEQIEAARAEAMEAAAERQMKYEEKLAERKEVEEGFQKKREQASMLKSGGSSGILKKSDSPMRGTKNVDFALSSPSMPSSPSKGSKKTSPKGGSEKTAVEPSDHARASFMRCIPTGPVAKFREDGTLDAKMPANDYRKTACSLDTRRLNSKRTHGRRSLMMMDSALLELQDISDIMPISPSALKKHEPLVVEEVDEDEQKMGKELAVKGIKWIREMQKKMADRQTPSNA